MKTHLRAGVVAVTMGALIAGAAYSRAQQSTAGKVGEKLDEAARAVKKGVGNVAKDVRESFENTRASVHSMGVGSRVYGRIHWDKALTDSTIEVTANHDASTVSVTLRGTVPDDAAKQKAVALARDTVGVATVVDQLTVGSPPGATTTTTTTKTTKTTTKPAKP